MKIGVNYTRWLYALVVLLTIIAALYLSSWVYGALHAVGNILALYFTAWLLQFFFTPIVDFLERRGVRRPLGVSFVYLVFLAVLGFTLVPATLAAANQAQQLARQVGRPQTYDFIVSTTQAFEKFLREHGVQQKAIADFTRNYSIDVNLKTGAAKAGREIQGIILNRLNASNLRDNVTTFLAFLNSISNLLLNFVIVLLLSFYMTLDGHKLARRGLSYFPSSVGEALGSVNLILNRKFGGYLRGQFILAASYGVLTYIIARGFGLQYDGFIGVFAAVMMLIPFIGAFAAVVPPLVGFALAHVSDFPVGTFLLLLLFLIISQQIVLNLLAPRVLGSAVGMHPLLVVLGLLLGAKVAGLWGAIFGVPIFAVMLDTVDLFYRRIMDRRGFHPPTAREVDAEGKAPRHPPDAGRAEETPGAAASRDVPAPAALHKAGVTLRPAPPPPDPHAEGRVR